MPAFPPITEADMRDLPRSARIAFAAKCGRRVQPLLRRFWTNPVPEALKAFDQAVTLAEQSAAQGIAVTGLDEALESTEVYSPWMAGNAKVRPYGGPPSQSSSPDTSMVRYAVALTAVFAARAAQEAGAGNDDASTSAALDACGWAGQAAIAVGVRGTEVVLSYDFSYLRNLAAKAGFTDATPVPPDSFAWEKELATYEREMPKLTRDEGKFVAIKGDQIVGVWDTYEDAAHAGYERFGLHSVLVKKIQQLTD